LIASNAALSSKANSATNSALASWKWPTNARCIARSNPKLKFKRPRRREATERLPSRGLPGSASPSATEMPNRKGSHLAAALCRQALWRRTPSPHRVRRSSVDLNEDRVEATHALKARPGGDLSHGKSGGIEQSLGPLHARGLGYLHRTGAGACAWASVDQPWQLFPAAVLSGARWAATCGDALN